MNYNELSRRAHDAAIKKGFWDTNQSTEHCMMLVITEIAEMVEADRKDKHADVHRMLKGVTEDGNDWNVMFDMWVKDTFEDELADVVLRLGDLAGSLGVDFDMMQPCRYFRAFGRFTVTENAFGLCKGLSRDNICPERRIQFGMDYCFNWAKSMNIDLGWHVKSKMRFNESRPYMNGKSY